MSGNQARVATLFPWWLVLALIIALGFAILGIWIYKRSLHREAGPLFKEKFHDFIARHQLFFSRFGLFTTSPLGQSFVHALKMMHIFVGGSQFRYTLPWVVMMGGSASGKSSILRSLGLDRPIGHSDDPQEGTIPQLCDWWFYDHGIVLDVDGRMVLNATYPTSDESSWTFFLSLLRHYRPRRPLDAVVLTIPASEFIGSTAFSHDDIMLRAECLYAKLWQMQRVTGLKIPIYIAISKCDLIPGFEDFCGSLPSENGSDIFGWSSDKGLSSAYTSDWIDEAFDSLESSLALAQEEIFTERRRVDGIDGVFVFPISFARLKKGIQIYTDHLFKSSSFHDSFFLRGLYFMGDSQCEDGAVASRTSLDTSWNVHQKDEENRHNIYFSNDLFEKKIFRERGLATPIARILLSGQTTNRTAKLAIATTAIVGTLCLLKANQTLRQAMTNLMSVLPQMESSLQKVQSHDSQTAGGRAYFAEQAHSLLETMAQTNVNVLFSPFLVPSWFSSLDDNIRDVMVIIYDKVILRSMADQLNYKAEKLVSLGEQGANKGGDVGGGVSPLKTQEFLQLNDYVENLHTLQLAADKFNSLGVDSTLGDIAEIIFYLFNYKMPDGFFVDNYYYVCALKQTKVRLFNYATYQENATLKLTKLFNAFQTAAFNPNTMIPGLAQLMVSFREFSEISSKTALTSSLVRDIFTGLDQTIRSLSNPDLRWLNQAHFLPGSEYEAVLQMIGSSEFFIEKKVQNLTVNMDRNFINFRKRLAGYTSPLLGGNSLFAQTGGLALAAPSPNAVSLRNSLKAFFNEPFMAPTSQKEIIGTIPTGSILLWDTLRLQEAVQLIATYTDFLNIRLLRMPKALQPLFQRLARDGLDDNLVELLVAAQTFGADVEKGIGFSPEDALMPQVQNYRAAAPFLEKILSTLWKTNATKPFTNLKRLLFAEAYSALENLDAILEEEAPYGLKMGSFAWWKGMDKASLEAFGVANVTELKHYLELQRDRIHYLAREFADPLVGLLERIEQEGMPDSAPLVVKWQDIINEFNGYERKTAGNSLRGLEEFIMTPLNEVTLATCQEISTAQNPTLHYDFFSDTLFDIQEKLHEQCKALSGTVSIDQYTHVASFFNANLAGRFPFVEKPCVPALDANPEDLRTFFEMMDTKAKGIKATLTQATDLGPAGKNALMFIEQMEALRAFFGDYLAPVAGSPEPAFTFDVTFRTNKGREVYANEVLTWSVMSDRTTLSMRSPSHRGYWKAGDPFKVVFDWASNSPLQPLAGGSPELEIYKKRAVYSYGGTWALLRLLRQHQAGPSDFNSLEDDHPTTLRFDIPLTNMLAGDGKPPPGCPLKATLFVSVAVSPAKAKKQVVVEEKKEDKSTENAKETVQMGEIVTLPYFPYHAPNLGGCLKGL